jgi:soluble lytic murein transglycosylase-like protein
MRFPTVLVPYMFLSDSSIKAIEMGHLRKLVRACAACFAILSSGLALAQQPDEQMPEGRSTEAGSRVATQADGFQLVEHGLWARPLAALQPAPSKMESPDALAPLKLAKQGSRRPSGFRRAGYLPHIYAAEAQFALPPGLLDALVWTESRYNPFAISHAGAVGMGQLMPGTARDLGVTNRYDPQANIFGAARYLRQMIDKFGMVHLALAAYNAGPRAVERAGGIPRNGETPTYVQNVLRSWRF